MMKRRRCGALLLGLLLPTGLAAQTVNSGAGLGPSQQVASPRSEAPAPEPVSPSVEHLLGNFGGVRTNLEAHGVYLLLDAISEFAGNVTGGLKQGATFANQVAFEADLDWQKLAGIRGLSTHVILINRSGSSDSALFGDNFLPVQEIYGAGGNVVVHLVSAYAQETLFDRRLDIAFGRMNVENDFASSPLYCNYMTNGLCGDPKSLPGGDIGHSAYPDSVWAARIRVRPTESLYAQTGVYEVNQGLYSNGSYRTGFEFDTSRDSGVYLPFEVGYEPKLGPAGLPGHYKIGLGVDTSHFTSFPTALSPALAPVGTARHGNTQVWVLGDQMLLRQGKGDQDGVIALAGYIHNDPHNSVYADQVFAGLLDRGFWRARPEDTVGLLFSYNTVSAQLSSLQSTELAVGLPLSGTATGPQHREMVVELNYDVHVARGVNFEPDFQYVVHPNAQPDLHDAAVLGFKAHMEF